MIALLVCRTFQSLSDIIGLMVKYYPMMDLNIQISFGYSKYLDTHLLNIPDSGPTQGYSIFKTLLCKSQSSFTYVPSSSNKDEAYKHTVVPISLHRIAKRCSNQEEKDHHKSFMMRILQNRHQDMGAVHERALKYYKNKKIA